MSIEIKVPILPESVTDATVARWYKKPGDVVARDENLIDLETDKVMLEVPAPSSGVLQDVKVKEGDVVEAGQLLAILVQGEVLQASASDAEQSVAEATESDALNAGPAARRAAIESNVDISSVDGSGRHGRVIKADLAQSKTTESAASVASEVMGYRTEKRVPMSRLRAKIAERLVEVQQSAALLTTFNEINMKPVRDLRARYKDQFEKKHGIRLGFMSFFTQAVVHALKQFPAVNASIDGNDIIYHNFFDIGIAIGSPRGLVVPILRNAENMSMADIEGSIKGYAIKAKEGKLAIDDMTGGTFTITNGGVYGSMMSTPIINPPQTAILGMHNIVDRAVVENGEIVIRPIMYVALSYDHRVIDGKESVSFLKMVKELIEDPARLIIGV